MWWWGLTRGGSSTRPSWLLSWAFHSFRKVCALRKLHVACSQVNIKYFPQGRVDCTHSAKRSVTSPFSVKIILLTRIQIRKKGKLPGDCAEASFDLEYGSATFAIQREAAVAEGKRVLIVDDLLATGGTLKVAPNSFSLLTPLTFSFHAFFAKLLPTFVAYIMHFSGRL